MTSASQAANQQRPPVRSPGMTASWTDFAARHGGGRAFTLLILLTVVLFLLMPLYNVVDYDVAFLTWTADQIMGPAVFGKDILDVSPPLCVLIYVPAALLAPFIGFEWGVRTWMLVLTILSLSAVWHTAGRDLRLPVATVLVLFCALAFPNHFAQREQIAFLLCAPYVAGPASTRRWGVLSGLMAGAGFMIKPHFLIPLALVFALRRRLGPEEKAIAAAGAAYAASLLLFFQPYLRDMVPAAAATYWAISFPWTNLALQAAFVLLCAVPIGLAGDRQPAARPYLAATLGFAVAAALQQKGFVYHFIPAFGFLALFLTVRTFNTRRFVAVAAALFLLLEAVMIDRTTSFWRSFHVEQTSERMALQAEIDRAGSYTSFVPEPYPAFPAAIHTASRFAGIAICPIFIPAVSLHATGQVQGDPEEAYRLARSQAIRELDRKPELVITMAFPYAARGKPFDILAWLNGDEDFRKAWTNYTPYRTIGPFRLYRLNGG